MLNLQKLQLDFKSKVIDPKTYPGLDLHAIKWSGDVNSIAISQGIENANSGITLKEIDKIIQSAIEDRNCTPAFLGYRGYKHASCLSVNDTAVHGIPDDYVLKDGDILSIDVGTIYWGWYTDAARTIIVGQPKNQKHSLLIEETQGCLSTVSIILKSGISLYRIAHQIQTSAYIGGINLISELGGHQIGFEQLHIEPFIPNVIPSDQSEIQKLKDYKLTAGQLICIEPVACLGSPEIFVSSDGWSIKTMDGGPTAHFEATFLITENGCEVISS